MKKELPAFLLFFLSLFSIAYSQDAEAPFPKKQYSTLKIEGTPLSIDGKLDEPDWNRVEWTGDYLQWRPDAGKPPTQQTAFKILYDDKNLYIAFRCYDSDPAKIVSRMSRRDGFEGDWVEINIDSNHDLRTAFSFTTSVSGVKGDEFISGDGNNFDDNWNPIWYTKTQIDSLGWTAELRIPLSQLRFSNEDEQLWGIQSTRRDFRMDERSTWQPLRQNDPSWVSRFGELHGLKGIKPQKQIEIQPYVLAQAESFEKVDGNPFATGSDSKISVGLDGKIGLTNDLSLDFTINPDFGQVEADPSSLTLDGFQVFFSEKRPFFIENRNIFSYQLTGSQAGGAYDSDLLFYSRRIGGSPHHSVDSDPDNGTYTDQPDNTTILAASKFSGKTKKGLSIGILESVTQREMATIDQNGERSEAVVEPLTNFFVGRLQKDFHEGNTVIGGIFTAVNRNIDEPSLEFLHRSAYSGGLDFIHRWKNKTWFVSGKAIFSRVAGTTEAITRTQTSFEHYFQRPDAAHLSVDTAATSLTGHGGTFKISNLGGKIIFEGGMTWRSPELEINDIGFLRNTDEINHFFWGQYRLTKPFSIFRSLRINYNHWGRWDFGGKNLYRAINTNFFASFKNFWGAGGGVTYENLDISNNALRGGPALRRPNGMGSWLFVFTDNRKKVNFDFSTFQAWGFQKAVRLENYSFGINIQPANALQISIRPSFTSSERTIQYITQQNFNGTTRYIAGQVEQKTLRLTMRLNYNITPDLTIQYYGQPFVSRGRYQDFKYISDTPLANNFFDRFQSYTEDEINFDEAQDTYFVDETGDGKADYNFGNPAFNFFEFRSNLVARWEYIPGSEIFLVWSQSNTAFEDPSKGLFPSLTDNLFGNKAHNIFLVKVTYRFLK